MAGSLIVAAFVKGHHVASRAAATRNCLVPIGPHGAMNATALGMTHSTIADLCVAFFEGIKTPATLISGSSLAALFSLTQEVNDTFEISKAKVVLMRIYHVCSLWSYILSLISLLTAHAGTATLLLGESQIAASTCIDSVNFLRTYMNTEYVITRWSFTMSILFFVAFTTTRMVIEFGLYTRRRRLAGVMVVSMMGGFMGSMLSYLNTRKLKFTSLWATTKELGEVVWKNVSVNRDPLKFISMSLFVVAMLCSFKFLLPGSIEHDQLLDTERFT